MHDFVAGVATRAGLAPDLAERAIGRIAAHLADHGPKKVVATLRAHVPEFDALALAGRDPAPTAPTATSPIGRIRSAAGATALTAAIGALLGGAEGGGTARFLTLIGELGRDGLDLDGSRRLASAIVAELRTRAGDAVVDDLVARMTGKVPLVARLFARGNGEAPRGD